MKKEMNYYDVLPTFNNIVQKLNERRYENWTELLEKFIILYNRLLESDSGVQFAPIINEFREIINKYSLDKERIKNDEIVFAEFKEKIFKIQKPMKEMLLKRLQEDGLRSAA